MIYGINYFGAPDIPPGVKQKFAQYVRFKAVVPKVIRCTQKTYPGCGCGGSHTEHEERTVRARLMGVAQSPEEKAAMHITASNGHRRLHWETRKTGGGDWYGLYVY